MKRNLILLCWGNALLNDNNVSKKENNLSFYSKNDGSSFKEK